MNNQFTQPKNGVSKETNKEAIARIMGVKKSEVTYLEANAPLGGYLIVYDKVTQSSWYTGNATGNAVSWALSGSSLVLITDTGSYTLLQAKAVSAKRVGLAANKAELTTYPNPEIVSGDTISIGADQPDFKTKGAGKIVSNGITITGADLTYNPATEAVIYNPGSYLRALTGEPYPTRENPAYIGQCYRFVLSQGSKLDDDTKNIHHVVAVGNTIGCAPIDWQYVDAFGGNAMMYAGRVSRTTALGSESMAWFGAPDQQWLIDKCHDYWRKPVGNPYLPGEPGWNAGELEANFPGMGTRLAAFTAYAATSDDAAYCTGVGRDALNHIVVGQRNTAAGYGSAQHMFAGSYNVALGSLSLHSCVFGSYNTAIGDQAGRLANDSSNSVYIGYGAGRSIKGSQGGIFIGDRTADGVATGSGCVIIGQQAGQDHPTTLDNKLIISNNPSTGNQPLFSGDFSKTFAGTNISPDKVRAHWHVRDGDSGSTLTPNAGLLVEGANQANLTLECNSTGFANILFADPASISIGGIAYSHSSDSMTMTVGGTARLRIENTGSTIPMVDNSYLLGRAAFRWGTIYAGTGTINTSDAREKTPVVKLTAKEIAVGLALSEEIGTYNWLAMVQDKGADARSHFGMTVQRAIEIFKANGLDAFEYGAVCYDKWEASLETRPAVLDADGNELEPAVTINYPKGDRYSFRPDEITYLMVGAIRANQLAIEKRLAALESK